jgi:hypothetical protein
VALALAGDSVEMRRAVEILRQELTAQRKENPSQSWRSAMLQADLRALRRLDKANRRVVFLRQFAFSLRKTPVRGH